MSASLRAPKPSDYEEIAAWVPDAKACLRWAGPHVPFPFSAVALPQLLSVANSESYCLVDESGALCGFGQFWVLTLDAVHLGRILVSPAMRGRGFGRELCSQLIVRALAATDASAVTLNVYRDNTVAEALYRSLGFVPIDSRCTPDALFMKLDIDPSSATTSGSS